MAFFGVALLLAAGCDSTGPGDGRGPGFITATLVSPAGSEGSAVFELTGGTGLGFVSSDGGETFYQHSAGSSRVVVVLDDPGVIRFQVGTGDFGDLPSVQVLQVADGQNQLRPSLTGYQVQVEGKKNSPSGQGGS
jgi:hypothetical protein